MFPPLWAGLRAELSHPSPSIWPFGVGAGDRAAAGTAVQAPVLLAIGDHGLVRSIIRRGCSSLFRAQLVPLHGGMLTIDLSFAALIPVLARQHQLIGVEMQGHGRTADIDREITPAALASDVVALLDQLGIDRAHVLGHSMGGAVTLELGMNHPDRVRSLVPASASVRPDGLHQDLTDPARQATSARMPTQQDFLDMQEAYQRLSPHPDHFNGFLATLSQSTADTQGWSDEQLATITAPILLVLGDRDFTTVEHGALMQQLIPGSQLAVLPGTTHMQVTRRADLLLPMLARFLD